MAEEKAFTCDECGKPVDIDLEKLTEQESDPEVKKLIADGDLKLIHCNHCGAESGIYMSTRFLGMNGHVSIIWCVSPSLIEKESFLREMKRTKSSKILDGCQYVFSVDELKNQAKCWSRVGDLRRWDNESEFKSKGGG